MVKDPVANDILRRLAQFEKVVHDDLADIRDELSAISHTATNSKPPDKKKALSLLTPEDRAKCEEAFRNADIDQSEKVDVMELRKMLEMLHNRRIPDSEFGNMMRDYDTNRDGELDFEEFLVCFAYTDEQKKVHFQQQGHSDLTDQCEVHAAEEQEIERSVKIDGVPMAHVTRYLRKELDETAACLQLPCACAIFIFFMIAVLIHYKFSVLHAVDTAITWDVEQNANFAFSGVLPFQNGRMGHKGIYDVNSIPDFWSWFSVGLAPLFWPGGWGENEVRVNTATECGGAKDALDGWGGWKAAYTTGTINSATIPAPCPEGQDPVQWKQSARNFFGLQAGEASGVEGNYLFFHSIVGGVRLRQERVETVSCSAYDKEIREALHKGKCKEDGHPYSLEPELSLALSMRSQYVNLPGGENVYLLSGWGGDKVREELRKLENKLWFSPRTSKVEITFVTYNAHQDLVTATYIFFFLNIGGHIHKIVEPVSFFMNPYVHWYDYLFDILWFLFIFVLFVEESMEVVKHWCQLGILTGTKEYMDFVNLVDWTAIIYSFVLVAVNALQIGRLKDLADIMKTGKPQQIGTFGNNADRSDFYEQVDVIVYWTLMIRTMLAVYPFIVVSRFFKAFASQPRLAMVTNTLVSAANDIIHFVVVFGTVFTVFVLCAIILWGQELEDFANFARTFHTVFRIMLGDFDWEELREIGRPQAYIWFWSFQWLVVLIMLNMLLAIIMDVYTEVKSHIGRAETLWSQSYEIWQRTLQVWKGHAVSLKRVLQMLDPTDLVEEDNEEEESLPVQIETLVEEHKLSEEQALEILIESAMLHETELAAHSSERKCIARIETKVTQMHGFLERYMHRGSFGGKFSATPSVTI